MNDSYFQQNQRQNTEPMSSLLQNLLSAINHANIAVEWVDCNTGKYLKVNEYAAQINGLSIEEMTGMLLWELDPIFTEEKFRAFVSMLRKEKQM